MKEQMISDLRALGVREGDSLLVHTAFSKLGKNVDPAEVIDALRTALGEKGTLVLPALSWANVTAANPVFDVNATPVCVGFLPEYFRRLPGVKRSVHPTHSCCAIGYKAGYYLESHALDITPVGPNSPFSKLARDGGKILFLGCTTTPNTSMHGIEELVVPDYLYGDDIVYTITDNEGRTYTKKYHTHGFARTAQRYERAEELLSPGEISRGKVLQAECTLMYAPALWHKAAEALRRDPHCMVDFY